jgi:uncharacterized protein YecT (DUF1311 family)
MQSLKSLVFALIRSRIALPALALVALVFGVWWALAPADSEPDARIAAETKESSVPGSAGDKPTEVPNTLIEDGSKEAEDLAHSGLEEGFEAPEEAYQEEPYPRDRAVEVRPALIKPSFNCAIAGLPAERLICGSAELATLDLELAATYKDALDRAKAYDRDYGTPASQVTLSTLVQDQNSWLRNSRNRCQSADCIYEAYRNRLAYLRRYQPR